MIVQSLPPPAYLSQLLPLLLSYELGLDRISILSMDDHSYRSSQSVSVLIAATSQLPLNNRVTLFRYPSGETMSSAFISVTLYLLIFAWADSTRLIILSGRARSYSSPIRIFIVLFLVFALNMERFPVPFITASRSITSSSSLLYFSTGVT